MKASSSLVTVTSEGANLYLQSKQTGTYSGTYSVTFSTSASFSSSPTGGTLSSSTTAAPVTVYSYNAMYDSANNVIGLSDSVMGMWACSLDAMWRKSLGIMWRKSQLCPMTRLSRAASS